MFTNLYMEFLLVRVLMARFSFDTSNRKQRSSVSSLLMTQGAIKKSKVLFIIITRIYLHNHSEIK